MKKKILSALLALSLAASLAGCGGSADSTPTPEATPEAAVTKLQGEAQGRNDVLKVEVTMNGETIEAVAVTEHAETEGIADPAIKDIPDAITASQSIAVDAVAGATITSEAIKAAVKDALTKGGLDTAKYEVAVEAQKTEGETETADVVIVGAGLAGLFAADEFKNNYPQYSVVVLEQLGQVGGSLPVTGGAILATDSKLHQENNATCTTGDIIAYLKESSHTEDLNDALIDGVYSLSGETLDHLVEAGWPVGNFGTSSPHNDKIYTAWTDGRGAAFQEFLLGYVEKAGYDLRLGSQVTDLVVEDGTVTGVKVEDKETVYQINAKAVLLCTGGFGNNSEMMEQYAKVWSEGTIDVNGGANGDGITFTRQFGTPIIGEGTMGTLVVKEAEAGFNSTFIVGPDGHRFINENSAAYRLQRATADLGGTVVRITTATDETLADLEDKVTNSGVQKFDTLEELAAAMGIDEAGLLSEVEEYNASVKNGGPIKFDLPVEDATDLTEGPFYAVKNTVRTFGTLVGIQTSDTCQVVDGEGAGVPGLYAAGEVMVPNAFTYQYPGAGFGISWAANSGRYAAQQVAATLN